MAHDRHPHFLSLVTVAEEEAGIFGKFGMRLVLLELGY